MMKPEWRECPRGDVQPQWAAIYVTMNPMGDIAMSRVTYERMGEPKAFVLLFDKVNSRIGLRPASLTARNAYPVRVHGRRGGKVIRGHRLTREFGIDLPHTVRFYDAHTDVDGIMILDLRTARVSPRAANHYRNRNKQESS